MIWVYTWSQLWRIVRFSDGYQPFIYPEDSHRINRAGSVKVGCAGSVGGWGRHHVGWVRSTYDCNSNPSSFPKLNGSLGGLPWRISHIEQCVFCNIGVPDGTTQRGGKDLGHGRQCEQRNCGDQDQLSGSKINFCSNIKPNPSRLSITGWSHFDA